jgi:hypothetical protein
MVLTRSLEPARGDADVHVFKCKICDVGFITEDHLPIAGVRVRGD